MALPSFSKRHLRSGSPAPGGSSLTTSAPQSASVLAAKGPAISGRHREACTADEVELLAQTGRQRVLAVENTIALEEVRSLKERLAEEIRAVRNSDEIVGNSAALRQVPDQVSIVAPTDSTVLIEGETGKGRRPGFRPGTTRWRPSRASTCWGC